MAGEVLGWQMARRLASIVWNDFFHGQVSRKVKGLPPARGGHAPRGCRSVRVRTVFVVIGGASERADARHPTGEVVGQDVEKQPGGVRREPP